jgi:hypothetical protein
MTRSHFGFAGLSHLTGIPSLRFEDRDVNPCGITNFGRVAPGRGTTILLVAARICVWHGRNLLLSRPRLACCTRGCPKTAYVLKAHQSFVFLWIDLFDSNRESECGRSANPVTFLVHGVVNLWGWGLASGWSSATETPARSYPFRFARSRGVDRSTSGPVPEGRGCQGRPQSRAASRELPTDRTPTAPRSVGLESTSGTITGHERGSARARRRAPLDHEHVLNRPRPIASVRVFLNHLILAQIGSAYRLRLFCGTRQ